MARTANVYPVEGVLREARALLAKPKGWTKKCYARTASGVGTKWTNPKAVSFCTLGAVHCADRKEFGTSSACLADEAGDVIREILAGKTGFEMSRKYIAIPFWNDAAKTRKKDVLAVFDAAIVRAHKKKW